jgi:hypothetical protein
MYVKLVTSTEKKKGDGKHLRRKSRPKVKRVTEGRIKVT